jgi:serine protease
MQFHSRVLVLFALAALATVSTVSHAQFVAAPGPAIAAPEPDQLIIKYRKEPIAAQLPLHLTAVRNVGARYGVSLSYKRRGALGFHVMKLDHAVTVAELKRLAVEIAAGDPNIEYAEPDLVMQAFMTPNDPLYGQQWHYANTAVGISLPSAWDIATGVGTRIAVLDSGFRPHADLAGNIVGGYDFITSLAKSVDGDGRDANAQDPGNSCGGAMNWHGTHVAGTLGAVTNNNVGVAGVAFGAQIVPVRVLGCGGGDTSDIADAIVWASGGTVSGVPANANPARVLNLSLGAQGAGSCGSTFQNAINSALSRNSVVVISAGNGSVDASSTPPGNCAGVITVAATDAAGGRADYSNFGSTVEIAAPGGDISPTVTNGVLSTYNDGVGGTPGFDNFAWGEGTSMAAPHAAGVASLILSAKSSLTPANVLSIMQVTSKSFPAACVGCGPGLLDSAAAVAMAAGPLSPQITDTLLAGCNGSYQLFWNSMPGATSYNVWRKTSAASKPSIYGNTTSTGAYVVAPMGGLTNFYVSTCQGASCGLLSQPASLPYYSGCP